MISESPKETAKIAKEFLNKIEANKNHATVVALSGDLGAGKTTFVKALAPLLGISANEVTSPTFVIMKKFAVENQNFDSFVHIDAYRLEKAEEIERLGWRELLSSSRNLILVEWPENIDGAMPKDAIKISFRFIDENSREIVFN